jgi:DNA-binding MarR family transcriptional regulator
VSGPELQHALGLDAATVRAHIAELARQGLVEWDTLLTNVWVRVTDKGLEGC